MCAFIFCFFLFRFYFQSDLFFYFQLFLQFLYLTCEFSFLCCSFISCIIFLKFPNLLWNRSNGRSLSHEHPLAIRGSATLRSFRCPTASLSVPAQMLILYSIFMAFIGLFLFACILRFIEISCHLVLLWILSVGFFLWLSSFVFIWGFKGMEKKKPSCCQHLRILILFIYLYFSSIIRYLLNARSSYRHWDDTSDQNKVPALKKHTL